MSDVARNIEDLFMAPLLRVRPLEALQDALLRNHEQILDINRAQLMEGENALTGAPLAPYKNYAMMYDPLTGQPLDGEQYRDYKHKLNPEAGYGNPDLNLTGSFQEKFFLTIGRDETTISSHDFKTRALERQYGRDAIFGIQKRNYMILAYFIRRQLIQNWRQQMQIR